MYLTVVRSQHTSQFQCRNKCTGNNNQTTVIKIRATTYRQYVKYTVQVVPHRTALMMSDSGGWWVVANQSKEMIAQTQQ